jgi:hypothetical protein
MYSLFSWDSSSVFTCWGVTTTIPKETNAITQEPIPVTGNHSHSQERVGVWGRTKMTFDFVPLMTAFGGAIIWPTQPQQ